MVVLLLLIHSCCFLNQMGKIKLVPLALGGLAIGTTEFVMMGLLPDIATEFKVSIPEAGYVISGYALGVVIGAPLLAVVGGGVAPKKMLMLLMLLFAVFNTLSACSRACRTGPSSAWARW
jgi:DHA1 family arabinose polymer transporter-like MFS transporter